MKNKNIKSTIKKHIQTGWREYSTIKIPYELLGLNRDDFATPKDFIELLGLDPHEKESGFVDHFSYYDHSQKLNGVSKTINFIFERETHFDRTQHEWNKGKYYYFDGEYYFTFHGSAGFVNPDYDVDDYEKQQEYWLNDGNGNCTRHEWELTPENVNDNHIEILKKFANNKHFEWDLLSDCSYDYIRDEDNKLVSIGKNKYNDLVVELSRLSKYNKTNYYEFTETHIEICYAIRYKKYVDDFANDLKKIVKKYKLKNWLVKN